MGKGFHLLPRELALNVESLFKILEHERGD